MKTEIEKWIAKANKKNPKLISYRDDVYDIVYFDKRKVRVGSVQDGMYCRYGIACRGAMYSSDTLSLWQSGPGACSARDVKIMQDYLEGKCDLPNFDFSDIRNLKH